MCNYSKQKNTAELFNASGIKTSSQLPFLIEKIDDVCHEETFRTE